VFDLAPLGRFNARPSPEMAYRACEGATSRNIPEGSVGAGTGCTVGKALGPQRAMKGGVGVAVAGQPGSMGVMAVAVVAVNAFGHVRDFDGAIVAGPRGEDGRPADTERLIADGRVLRGMGGGHTTISVVALNVSLAKVELHQVARAASAAYYRRIGPTGTSFDGDVIFAVSPTEGRRAPLIQAEVAATAALEHAILRAVRMARGREGLPGLAD
jgi:L-aminopeptidase/D-esterase-like protein